MKTPKIKGKRTEAANTFLLRPKALPLHSIRAGRSCPRWISPGLGAGPGHAGAAAPLPGHPGGPRRPRKAAGRVGVAARLSARRRGRTCPGSAAPINFPRAEGAAGAPDPRRAQRPALDLSRIRSRPRTRRSRCTASRAPRRPTAGRRPGRSCRTPLYPATWPIDHPGNERAVGCAHFTTFENTRYVADLLRNIAKYSTKSTYQKSC